MELEFENGTARFLRPVLSEQIAQEETAESLIPESSPDAARLLGCYCAPIVRSRSCRDGSLSVSGGIRTDLLYAAQDGSVHRLENYLPFTAHLERERLREGMTLLVRCCVESAEARLVSPRRLIARVGIRTAAEVYAPAEEALPRLVPQAEQVQTRERTVAVCWPVAAGERVFTIHDVLPLPPGRPAVQTLLNCRYDLRVTDARMAGSKAVWKGEAAVRVLYLDEGGALCAWTAQTPFSQYMELEGGADEDGLFVLPLLTDAECRAVPGGVEIELTCAAQCLAMARQELTVTEDAYALRDTLAPTFAALTLPSRLDTQRLPQSVRAQTACSFETAIDVTVYPGQAELVREGETVRISAPIRASLLYLDRENAPAQASLRFACEWETTLAPQAFCRAEAETDGAFYAAPAPEGAEVRGRLACVVRSDAEQEIRFLTGAALEPAAQPETRRPSVVLRAAEEAESLWSIAKACRTSVAAIREANALRGDEPEAGQLLLIPTV